MPENIVSLPVDINGYRGVRIPVLDDGFVRLVDYMGNDRDIAEAARTSYGEGTKTVNDNRGLIRTLIRYRHSSPIEMAEIKFHIRVPMDVWRQWERHRTFMNVNEYSTRYSIAIDSAQRTDPDSWRLQSKSNKQGSAGFLDHDKGEHLTLQEEAFQINARAIYQHRLDLGVAREQARKDLPLCNYTELYIKVDLHNLLHFLALRMDEHAQQEIRDYANAISNIVKVWVPQTWEAFEDYRLNGMQLSRMEVEAINIMIRFDNAEFVKYLVSIGWLTPKNSDTGKAGDYIKTRECREFSDKLDRIGILHNFALSSEDKNG